MWETVYIFRLLQYFLFLFFFFLSFQHRLCYGYHNSSFFLFNCMGTIVPFIRYTKVKDSFRNKCSPLSPHFTWIYRQFKEPLYQLIWLKRWIVYTKEVTFIKSNHYPTNKDIFLLQTTPRSNIKIFLCQFSFSFSSILSLFFFFRSPKFSTYVEVFFSVALSIISRLPFSLK